MFETIDSKPFANCLKVKVKFTLQTILDSCYTKFTVV